MNVGSRSSMGSPLSETGAGIPFKMFLSSTEWGMHGQPPPPPPPPDQAWIPPGSGPMDVVTPSEDSNSQDSAEFNSEARHGVYPQNSHGYGAQPDSYAMAPMAMNQFDYQVCRCSSRKC